MISFATLKMQLDTSDFNRKLKGADRNLKTFKGSAITTLAKIGAAFYAIKKGLDFGKIFFNASLDAKTMRNVFKIAFKKVGDEAEKSAKRISRAYGLSIDTVKSNLANTGDLLTGLEFDPGSALNMSIAVADLSTKLALFRNLNVSDVTERITKGLLGETESMKLLGIKIDQTSQKYRNSVAVIQKTLHLTKQQAKAQVILNQALSQSKNAINSFAESSGSMVAKQMKMNEAWKDLKIAMGDVLTGAAEDGMMFEGLTASIKGLTVAIKNLGTIGSGAVLGSLMSGVGFAGQKGKQADYAYGLIKNRTMLNENNALQRSLNARTVMGTNARNQGLKPLEATRTMLNDQYKSLNKSVNLSNKLVGIFKIAAALQIAVVIGKVMVAGINYLSKKYNDLLKSRAHLLDDIIQKNIERRARLDAIIAAKEKQLQLDKLINKQNKDLVVMLDVYKNNKKFEFLFNTGDNEKKLALLKFKLQQIVKVSQQLNDVWRKTTKGGDIQEIKKAFNKYLEGSKKVIDVQFEIKNMEYIINKPKEEMGFNVQEIRQDSSTSVAASVRQGTVDALKLENTYLDKTESLEANTKATANNTREGNKLLAKISTVVDNIVDGTTSLTLVDPLAV